MGQASMGKANERLSSANPMVKIVVTAKVSCSALLHLTTRCCCITVSLHFFAFSTYCPSSEMRFFYQNVAADSPLL
jgi:hypothetical protein